ncbi:TetR/AcrR family transcriptional regulator [Flexivirga sp. ID2601S]|uniref:TetR/AcrR family transcriptional regulator n=1 Tax=Flexivirga aerilata TaxID=1656889 RepID=A0A849ANB2_9MICO|nr:TetR/AcrR family transcriptional regulator [Flexivirga aerilata]
MPSDKPAPPRLTREAILDVAGRLVTVGGADALSMRKLAGELGVSPMALYRHVQDRDELLVALLDREFEAVVWPPLPDPGAERAVQVMLMLHRELASRPWVLDALTRGDLMAPSAARATDDVLGSLRAAGCSPQTAAIRYAAAWRLTLGALLVDARTASAVAGLTRPTVQEQVRRDADPETFPALVECGDALRQQRQDFDVEHALRLILAAPPE